MVCIKGTDFAVELLKQNLTIPDNRPIIMMIAFILALVPVFVGLAEGKTHMDLFQNSTNHLTAYLLSIFPALVLKTMNIYLSDLLRVFYQ